MQAFIEQIYGAVFCAIWPSLRVLPPWLILGAGFLVGGLLILGWMALMAMAWVYAERKISAFIQARLGPNRVGPLGLLQSIADAIKLLTKEDVAPAIANRFLYTLAPLLVFMGAFIPFVALPFSGRLVVANMELGLYYILAFEAIEVIGILMAGWAPGSKWSLYGGMRLAAQLLSYEIPMGLCVLVIVVMAGSLNLAEIVRWQSHDAWGLAHPWILGWAIFRSPAALVAFVLFYIGGLASAKRAPFDLPEAESELVAGYHTEYSGMRFSFFFMAEYGAMYVICALATILFLGGWYGPIPLPGVPEGASIAGNWAGSVAAGAATAQMSMLAKGLFLVKSLMAALTAGSSLRLMAHEALSVFNLLLKTFALYFVMIWVRWTLPRVRIDQVMYLCLKVLLPFALACVIFAAIQVVLF